VKKCSTCKNEKELKLFGKLKASPDGLAPRCKPCISQYYKKNSSKLKEYSQKYREDNREEVLEKKAQYTKANRSKINKYQIELRAKTKDDPLVKLARAARGAVRRALGPNKDKASLEYLGCSTVRLKEHLQSQFKDGMSWDNYGEWHVDHIIPICVMRNNIDDTDHVDEILNFKNLQPLWGSDNISKGGRTYCRIPTSHPAYRAMRGVKGV